METGLSAELWRDRADAAQAALRACYLRPLGIPGLGVAHSPPSLSDRLRGQYWWQAHLLDVLVDRQRRHRTLGNGIRIRLLPIGQRLANHGSLVRDYYDDMGWMALALLRAGEREQAERLWLRIRDGWNDHHGGGIPWRVQQPTYKNTPANGPAAILAARLGHHDWAQRIVRWMESVLLDTATGEVQDGIDRSGDGALDTRQYSYNYGVAMAAELELGRRELAQRVAETGVAHCATNGVLHAEGRGDGPLFHGIFARYLTLLGTEPGRSVVLKTADATWEHRDGQGRFGPDPQGVPTPPVELSAMVSAVMTLEAATRLA